VLAIDYFGPESTMVDIFERLKCLDQMGLQDIFRTDAIGSPVHANSDW
jgi:hypothetical protein